MTTLRPTFKEGQPLNWNGGNAEAAGNERKGIRESGLFFGEHPGVITGEVCFLAIARTARRDDVLPSARPTLRARHHMIQRQLAGGKDFPAILTLVSVPEIDVGTTESDAMRAPWRFPHVTDHGRDAPRDRRGRNGFVVGGECFHPFFVHKFHGHLPPNHPERAVPR